MSGMFLNYQDIARNYTPNNLIKEYEVPKSYTKLDPSVASMPYECYNAKGELEGYCWYYGDILNLEFNIDGEITVGTDSILYKASGQVPNDHTVGSVGQKIYNIVDLRSWECVGFSNNKYEWAEDAEFTYPLCADKSVYISAQNYLKDKNILFKIYNFRYEEIYTQGFTGSSKIIVPITRELSEKLLKGIYYCSLSVHSGETNQVIFAPQDCKLIVK